MMGHIIEWYYNGIAGIIPTKPGFAEVTIKPYLPDTMHEFTCTYSSVRGEINVHVKERENDMQVHIDVPDIIKFTVDTSDLETKGKQIYGL